MPSITCLVLVAFLTGATPANPPKPSSSDDEKLSRVRELMGLGRLAEAEAMLSDARTPRQMALRAILMTPEDAKRASGLGLVNIDAIEAEKLAKAAVPHLIQLAKKDATAAFLLGVLHYQGLGVTNDPKRAYELMKFAADKGDAAAIKNMGVCYLQGIGVEKNPRTAIQWFRKAASAGNASAMLMLGVCYQKGIGGSVNEKTAELYLRRAAEKGHSEAMTVYVGKMLDRVISLRESLRGKSANARRRTRRQIKQAEGKCRKWLLEAAGLGNRHAWELLAKVHDVGVLGFPRNPNESHRWRVKLARTQHDWDEKTWKAIEERKVFIGMTAEQARMSWGEPKSVNRTIVAGAPTREQWVYSLKSYLYFDDGVLTGIQN